MRTVNYKKLAEEFRKAGLLRGNRAHVIHVNGNWVVKKEGFKKASRVKPTKLEAINFAKKIRLISSVIVHKKDGSIESNLLIHD